MSVSSSSLESLNLNFFDGDDFSSGFGSFPEILPASAGRLVAAYQDEGFESDVRFARLFGEYYVRKASPEKIAKIAERLEKGANIAARLMDIDMALPIATREAALDLTWFLMGAAFEEHKQIFIRGVVRVPMSSEQSTRFKHFYKSCNEADAHNRPSSHFKRFTIGHQKGLDYERGQLPLDDDLRTIVCARLRDGGFFLKLETEPLSWTKLASIKHLGNWVLHKLSGGGRQVVGGLETARETDKREKVKHHFRKVQKAASESGLKVKATEDAGPVKYVRGMHRRVSNLSEHVIEELDKRRTSAEPDDDLISVLESVEEFHEEVAKLNIQRPDIAHGGEVILHLDERFLPKVSAF